MKNYANLDTVITLNNFYETNEDYALLSGIAINHEDVHEFLQAVEQLAVQLFGGATFEDLLDQDEEDACILAAIERNTQESFDRVIEEAERIMMEPAV